MVTKGIITAIDFKGNTCTVRMPFFETANNDPIVMNATFSNTPGMYNGYKVDDVVWVAFEDGQMEAPVILGKLYLGAEKEKSDPRGTVNTENVNASNTATIPADTKLKSNVGKEMPNTAHPYSSLSSVANDLNSLNKDVEYHNWYYENKIKNLTSVANGKSTTYYSDTDPSTDATITLYTGDTWFNTNPNKYFNIGPKEERKDYVGYWIINPDYDPADPDLPQYLEITEDNYNDIAELANLPDAYTRASLYEWYEGDKSWHEVDSEIVANKVTAAFVNALQITAKKIEVKNSEGDILFKANGLPDEPDTNKVQIANFNVDNNSLYIGTPGDEGSVLVSTGTTGIEHAITIETVDNYGFIKSTVQNIDGYTRFESTNQGIHTPGGEEDEEKNDTKSVVKITAIKPISLDLYFRSNGEFHYSSNNDTTDYAYDYLIISTKNAIRCPTTHEDQYTYNSTYYDHFTANEEAEDWEETLDKYKKVTYTLDQNDYIYVVYIKDESVSVYPDTGYFLISNILLGDDFSIGNSPKRHGWAFTAGDGFGVTNDGNLYSNSGNIASWVINPSTLESTLKLNNGTQNWLTNKIILSPNYTLNYHPFYRDTSNNTNWSFLIMDDMGVSADNSHWNGKFGITVDGEVTTKSLKVLGGSLEISGATSYDDWEPNTSYEVDDLVVAPELRTVWRCIANHTSSSSFDDDSLTYWIVTDLKNTVNHSFTVDNTGQTSITNGSLIESSNINGESSTFTNTEITNSLTTPLLEVTKRTINGAETRTFEYSTPIINVFGLANNKGSVSMIVYSYKDGVLTPPPQDTFISAKVLISYSYWAGSGTGGIHIVGPDGEDQAVGHYYTKTLLVNCSGTLNTTSNYVSISSGTFLFSGELESDPVVKSVTPTFLSKDYGVVDIVLVKETPAFVAPPDGETTYRYRTARIHVYFDGQAVNEDLWFNITATVKAKQYKYINSQEQLVDDNYREDVAFYGKIPAGQTSTYIYATSAGEDKKWPTSYNPSQQLITGQIFYKDLEVINIEWQDGQYQRATITTTTPILISKAGSKNIIIEGHLQPDMSDIDPEATGWPSNYNIGSGDSRWNTIYCDTLDSIDISYVNDLSSSDQNLKQNINYDMSSFNPIFDSLKPVSYQLKIDNQKLTRFGLIAQDVEQSFQEAELNASEYALIHKPKNATDHYKLDYTNLHALEIYEIQQLKKQVKELTEELAKLKNKA